MQLDKAIEQYLETVGNSRSRETYRYALLAMCRHLKENDGNLPLQVEDLGTTLLEDLYLVYHENLSHYTANSYVNVASLFLTWLEAHELLSEDLNVAKAKFRLQFAKGRKRQPYPHKKIDPELPAIVTYYDDQPLPMGDGWQARQQRLILLRNRAIVHTLYACGGRVSEVASLQRDDLLDGRLRQAQVTQKGGYTHILLFTSEALRAIRAYLGARADNYPAMFISHGRNLGQPLGRGTIWSIVKQAAKALDLHESTSPHSFRHYRATQLLNEGMPLESVQAYLGHQDIATTRKVYAHTRTDVLRDQLDTFGRSPTEALADLERETA
jgi:integrase/recombinase XerD